MKVTGDLTVQLCCALN